MAGANGIGPVLAQACDARSDQVMAAAMVKAGPANLCDAAGTALKRPSDPQPYPQDVTDMALFPASDPPRLISGQALAVDGMTFHIDP